MKDLFFQLIQVAAGTRAELSRTPSAREWQLLLSLARMQAITGVLFDAVEKLPDPQKPDGGLMMLWIGWQSKTIAQNRILDARSAELTGLLAAGGFGACILKGQGTALFYPDPGQRKCGDIDIWVEGDRRRLVKYLGRDFKLGFQTWHHTAVAVFDDVEVEVHHHPTWLCNPFNNKKLQRYFRECWPLCRERGTGKGFNAPAPEFAAVHCLVHIFRHLLEEGVGLRQVFDLYYILRAVPEALRAGVYATASSVGLGRFTGGLMFVMREIFGLPESGFLCPVNQKYGTFMLREMIVAGNFGKFDRRNAAIEADGRLMRLLRKFFGRQSRFLTYFPSEVLWIVPWRLWQFFIWRPLNRIR